jgi:hypothetical protein
LTRCQPNFYQSRCTRQPGLCDEGYHGYGGVCKPCGDLWLLCSHGRRYGSRWTLFYAL